MKIKRLEISGFKSFVDKTVLRFDHDVTCVVGPNGCGKSNIVDAIRWVMGEQSAKNLRGRGMEDVIFNGSEARGPHGFAEVTITFDNADGIAPPEYRDYTEIAVTRKLYRGGDGEYYINKQPVRLLDVTNLFLGTGVGKRAYSIIEQGRIGFIVSAKPEDRRFLIEEAAGITKFKAKKKAAERKIELTQQNLLRVADIVAELEKNLASLERQAQKAARYKAYRAELRDLELTVATQRYFELSLQHGQQKEELAKLTEATESLRNQLEAEEARLETERLAMHEAGQTVEKAQAAHYESENKLRLLESQIEHNQESIAQLESTQRLAEREIEELSVQRQLLEEESLGLEKAIEPLFAQVTDDDARLSEQISELEEAKSRAEVASLSVSSLRQQLNDVGVRRARAETVLAGFEKRLAESREREARLIDEEEKQKNEFDRLVAEKLELVARIDGLRAGQTQSASEKLELESSLDRLRKEIRESDGVLEELRNRLSTERSRLRSLEELQAKFEGVGAGVRNVMTRFYPNENDRRGAGIAGLVSDRIDCSPELSIALASVLSEKLQYIVVSDVESGKSILDQLSKDELGRATVIPRAPRGVMRQYGELREEGVVGPLVDLVSFASEDEALVRHLLAGVWVVESFDVAVRLSESVLRDGVAELLVTREGEILAADGSITGGRGDDARAHSLDVKHEIRELQTRVVEFDEKMTAATNRHGELRNQIASHQALLEQARLGAHEAEVQAVRAETDLKRHEQDVTRIEKRRVQIVEELAALKRVFEDASQEENQAKSEMAALGEEQAVFAAELGEAEGLLSHRQQELEGHSARLTEMRVGAAANRQKLDGDQSTLERMKRSIAELDNRRERLSTNIVESSTQRDDLFEKTEGIKQNIALAMDSVVSTKEALGVARDAYEAMREALNQKEVGVREIRASLQTEGERLTEVTLLEHETKASIRHLFEQVDERYRIDLRTVLHEFHFIELAGDAVTSRIDDLKRLIDRMGEINLLAIEEYKEKSERYEYLKGQKVDLESAIVELEKAIRQMNKESRRLFKEAFEAINVRFQAVFPRMFGGGKAELKLTDSENLLDTGVEIIAQPPGKRLGAIELMSGGEKALTAVSLIFAIFQYKPSPFCLLDEVDAPLDEANVGRFADSIREMTDRSQFIVISHSKRTMETADVLYGVTMEEPGISKLVSVELRKDSVKNGVPVVGGEQVLA